MVLMALSGCCTQFDLLVELFHDEEKATTPTGAPTGKRMLSVKPDKGRPSMASKEHKKTVGLQVCLVIITYFKDMLTEANRSVPPGPKQC